MINLDEPTHSDLDFVRSSRMNRLRAVFLNDDDRSFIEYEPGTMGVETRWRRRAGGQLIDPLDRGAAA